MSSGELAESERFLVAGLIVPYKIIYQRPGVARKSIKHLDICRKLNFLFS